MQFTLPADVHPNMPRQYVRHIGNPELAAISDASSLPDRVLDVSVTETDLYWHHGSEMLRVALTEIGGAHLTLASFGPNDFPVFVLRYGDPDSGGVILLNTNSNATFLREFSASVAPLIPHGVDDRLP